MMLKLIQMHIKQKVKLILYKISKFPIWVNIFIIVILCLLSVHLFALIQQKNINFSYNSKSICIQQVTFFPNFINQIDDNSNFNIIKDDVFKIGNIQIFSSKTCFSAKNSPTVGDTTISVAYFGGWFAKETWKINVPQPPSLNVEVLSLPISVINPLEIPLSSGDLVFDYKITINDRTTSCPIKNTVLHCDIASLSLSQGKDYMLEVVRSFNNNDEVSLIKKDIKTIDAAVVVLTSVAQDQIIYDNPMTFTFEFNKEIVTADIILEQIGADSRTSIPMTTVFNNKLATITLQNNLGRNVSYEFTISKLESQDSSTLDAPCKLGFKTSSGPIVIDVSSSSVGMPLSQTIVLTFDQALSDNQDINNFVSAIGFPTTISKLNNQVFINYTDAPICANLNINIAPGIQSNYGIAQYNPQTFSLKTICHTVSVIGYSVQGRPILAYIFGSGSTTILFTGGIHGSESSGSYIMYDWIYYLESNASSIPTNKKIVVVPEVNPDGLALLSRYNVNNVNIDRNFSSVNWTPNIDTGNGIIVNGGGVSAMSEPETRALAGLTMDLMPRLEISFHAQGNLVGANQYGDSVAIANLYVSSVGYRSMVGQAEAIMGYSITGEYEDWAGEQGIPAILIELPSLFGNYFSEHQYILWEIINL